MNDSELRLAKRIGEQMSDKILCPRNCVEGQMLSVFGDFEDQLFCPHCELEVRLAVLYGDSPATATSLQLQSNKLASVERLVIEAALNAATELGKSWLSKDCQEVQDLVTAAEMLRREQKETSCSET